MVPAMAADSVAGRLLVARASLDDPNFSRTVVLVVRHDADGAFGLVLNRFAENRGIAEILALFGLTPEGDAGEVPVHFGGPVGQSNSLALHGTDFETDRTEAVDSGYGVSPTVDTLRALAEGQGPAKVVVFFGYAGWSPGQLEAELAADAWAIVDADEDLVLSDDAGTVWLKALARVRVDL